MQEPTPTRDCASCGQPARHLITARYDEASDGGRLMFYCEECRNRQGPMRRIGMSVPLSVFEQDPGRVLVLMYETGAAGTAVDTMLDVLGLEVTRDEHAAMLAGLERWYPGTE